MFNGKNGLKSMFFAYKRKLRNLIERIVVRKTSYINVKIKKFND